MKKIYCFILLIFSVAVVAQRINNFEVYLVGKTVGVNFTISKGTTCNGYSIKHSIDSIHFSIIYNFPGICGDTLLDVGVNYTHLSPVLNTVNYYKVDLIPIETSKVKRIFVPEAATNKIYPNPISSALLTVRINNLQNAKLNGSIYSQKGTLIKVFEATSVNDFVSIAVGDLENGMYLIKLNDGQKTYSYKFIIAR